jgi:hypothetical protein
MSIRPRPGGNFPFRLQTGAGAIRGPRFLPFLLAAILVLTSACQRSTGGPLEPVPSAGIEAGQDRSAVPRDGDIIARVTARWSSTEENSLRINYRNAGQVRCTVAIDGLKMTHSTGEAALRTAVDATGGDLSNIRTDNDRPRVIFVLENDTGTPSTLDLPPGVSRDVDAELTSFSNGGLVQTDDRIVATIPMGDRTTAVTFVARNP